MALNGSFDTDTYSTSSHGYVGLRLSWTATQSIENNTSTIKWTLKSFGTMSSGYSVKAGPVTVKINGTTVLNTTSRFNMYGGGKYSKSGSITVAHNTDGTKTVSMSVRAAIYSASVNCTGSSSPTLNRINRYALITATENFTDEGSPTITFSNPAGVTMVTNLKARIKWTATEEGQQVEHATPFENIPEADWTGGQHTFNISNEDRALMRAASPTANALPIVFDLQSTMQSTDYHDTKTGTMEIINANPTPGAVSFREMNDAVYAITGSRTTIVQKKSTLRIHTEAATPTKSATIVSYSLNINGNDYTPDSSGNVEFIEPDVSGTYRATVTVTDSRGNTATAYIDVPILQWTEPSAVYTVGRRENFYADTILNVDGTIATIPGSQMTITEKHKKTTEPETAWSQWATLPDAQDYTITLAIEDEWEIIIRVTDAFTFKEYRVTVGKGIPIKFTDTRLHSFAINGMPDEADQLFVGGTIKATGKIKSRGVEAVHEYSTEEKPVGFWIDGSIIYEKTIQLPADITVGANAWLTNAYTHDENITVLNGEAYYYDSNSDVYVSWGFMAIQSATADKTKVNIYNSRNASCQVNILTLRYIKPTTP